MTATITHYTVTNPLTGKTTSYKSGLVASRAAERINMGYGAHLCSRKAHWSDEAA